MNLHRKRRVSVSHPAFVAGRVVFEFWNNDSESERNRILRDLAKSLHHKMNVSATPIFDPSDLERGEMVFAGSADSIDKARRLAAQAMEFLENESSARIVHDSWIAEELP